MKRIGITQRVEVLDDRGERRDALDQRWSHLLEGLGVVAVPLPNRESLAERYLLDMGLDGVIFSGGSDPIAPSACLSPASDRDAFERRLLGLCLNRGVPILGVCRGAQFLNLYFGGSIGPVSNHVRVRHHLKVEANTLGLSGVLDVNSFHESGISQEELSEEFRSLAVCEDGTVEAFYHPSQKVTAILWHPERELTIAHWDRILIEWSLGLR